MDLLQRVLSLETGKKRLPSADDWIYITHILCKTYGWTWQELMRTPIKFCFNLMSKIAWEKKKEEQSMKKK